MKFKFTRKRLAILVLAIIFTVSCGSKPQDGDGLPNDFPQTVLWAWERPENLEFVDAKEFAVAYLAQTLILERGVVVFRPRQQPLRVNPATKLIAVTRLETAQANEKQAFLNGEQKSELLELIIKTLDRKNVAGIQIDFDAAVSEREFYRQLIVEVRRRLPVNVSLSITAIASVCLGDRWFDDLPIAEAVPMIFRMGADDKRIKAMLANGEDFREPLCRASYGVALDEVFPAKLDRARRLYVFNKRAWTPEDAAQINQNFR